MIFAFFLFLFNFFLFFFFFFRWIQSEVRRWCFLCSMKFHANSTKINYVCVRCLYLCVMLFYGSQNNFAFPQLRFRVTSHFNIVSWSVSYIISNKNHFALLHPFCSPKNIICKKSHNRISRHVLMRSFRFVHYYICFIKCIWCWKRIVLLLLPYRKTITTCLADYRCCATLILFLPFFASFFRVVFLLLLCCGQVCGGKKS